MAISAKQKRAADLLTDDPSIAPGALAEACGVSGFGDNSDAWLGRLVRSGLVRLVPAGGGDPERERLAAAAATLRALFEPEGPEGPRLDADGIDAAEDLLAAVDAVLAAPTTS